MRFRVRQHSFVKSPYGCVRTPRHVRMMDELTIAACRANGWAGDRASMEFASFDTL